MLEYGVDALPLNGVLTCAPLKTPSGRDDSGNSVGVEHGAATVAAKLSEFLGRKCRQRHKLARMVGT